MSETRANGGGAGRRAILGVGLAVGAIALILAAAFVVRQGVQGGPAPASASSGGADALVIEEILRSSRGLLSRGEYGKAEALLAPAVARNQTDQDLRLALAEALLGQREFEAAHEQFVAAIAIGPDTAPVRFDAASVASAAGLDADAEEHYWAAQSMDPRDPRYPLYLAQVQRKLDKTSEAKKNLLIAARLDPSLDIAWGTLADIALEENNLSIAQGHIERARELAPERLAWRILEARIARRGNDPERAVALLSGLSPEERAREPMALREMALSLGLMNEPERAAALYADASTMLGAQSERLGETLRLAAEWYERAGMVDEAIVYASRAARAGDEKASALLDRLQRRATPSETGGSTGGGTGDGSGADAG